MERFINYKKAKEEDINIDMYCWSIHNCYLKNTNIIDSNNTINPVFSLWITKDNIKEIKENIKENFELVLIK